MNFLQTNRLRIIHDNILTTTALAPASADLIVTSPPYNVDIQYSSHNDDVSYEEYLEFSRKWMTRCYEWVKDGGRFCLNVPLDKNKGGQQSVAADLTVLAKEVGWKYHSTIIWNEQNISRRTAWGSWMKASAPYVIAPVEVVIVLFKEVWKRDSNNRVSTIARDEFIEWTNGYWTFRSNAKERKSELNLEEFVEWTNGFWNFSGESKKRIGHPAPFPIELPRRCIKLFSFMDDVVLDPFLGSGTTAIAALQNDRRAVGIEVDEKYCQLAVERLKKERLV